MTTKADYYEITYTCTRVANVIFDTPVDKTVAKKLFQDGYGYELTDDEELSVDSVIKTEAIGGFSNSDGLEDE